MSAGVFLSRRFQAPHYIRDGIRALPLFPLPVINQAATMSSISGTKTSHLERTIAEPRDPSLHDVFIRDVHEVNSSIRLFKLGIPEGKIINFRAGQWLDVYVPTTTKAGGFTITSSPSQASSLSFPTSPTAATAEDPSSSPAYPHLELAIQHSPSNPPAAYLFRPVTDLLNQTLQVRVGGSFTYPPPRSEDTTFNLPGKVIFLAGGVGINPLISMASAIAEMAQRGVSVPEVQFFYSTKLSSECISAISGEIQADKILFLERLMDIFTEGRVNGKLNLFFTGDQAKQFSGNRKIIHRGKTFTFEDRRMGISDVSGALTSEWDRVKSVVYVCGVPGMTDYFVEQLTSPDVTGLDKDHVLFEKWW